MNGGGDGAPIAGNDTIHTRGIFIGRIIIVLRRMATVDRSNRRRLQEEKECKTEKKSQ
jgi:hypothetical protein